MLWTNKKGNMVLNSMCFTIQLIFLIYEGVTICAQGGKKYLMSWFNWIDMINITAYMFYFFFRMQNLTADLIPSIPTNLIGGEHVEERKAFFKKERENTFKLYCPFFHTVLILAAFVKLLYFLRCN